MTRRAMRLQLLEYPEPMTTADPAPTVRTIAELSVEDVALAHLVLGEAMEALVDDCGRSLQMDQREAAQAMHACARVLLALERAIQNG